MKTRRTIASLVLLGALGLAVGLGLPGCATSKDKAFRHLKRGEARELLAMQGLRQQAGADGAEGLEKITDTKRLEAMGDSKAAQGDLSSALFFYTRSLALDKGHSRVTLRGKIAAIYLHVRQFPQAEGIFQDLVRIRPNQAIYWQGLGLARLGQGNREAARSALEQAVGLDPKLWKAYNGLGMLYNQDRKFDQAIAAFSRAINLQPRSPQLYNNLGMSYVLKNQFAKAEQCFRYALKLNPTYKLAANNLGLVYARQGKYAKARRAFSRGSGKAQAHNNVGCFLAWAGKNERAAEEFRQALRLSPSYYPLAGRHLKQITSLSGAMGGGESDDPLLAPPVTVPVTKGRSRPPRPKAPARPAVTALRSPVVLTPVRPAAKPDEYLVNRLMITGRQDAPPSGFGWGQGEVGFDQKSQGVLGDDM